MRTLYYIRHASLDLPARPISLSLAPRIPPLALTLVAGGLAWALARACPPLAFETWGHVWIAGVLFATGAASSGAGIVAFRKARTTVNPFTPHASSALVTSGIYRVTRNPMYLGFLCLLLGECLLLGNLAGLTVGPAFVGYLNRFQIVPEERALEARFGRDFQAYTARVRRWI